MRGRIFIVLSIFIFFGTLIIFQNADFYTSNAHQLASRLNRIFQSNATENAQINDVIKVWITDKIIANGGFCHFIETNCTLYDYGKQDRLPFKGGTSVSKIAFINRACDEILNIDVAVDNVLTNSTAGTVADNIDGPRAIKLFKLFYPGKTPPTAVTVRLVALFNAAKTRGLSNRNAWRVIIYPLCVSPGIQTL